MRNFKDDNPIQSRVAEVEHRPSKLIANQLIEEIEDAVLVLKRYIVVEYFGSGALLLNLHTRKVTEVDACESWILSHLDGKRTMGRIAADYSQAFALTREQGIETVKNFCRRIWKDHWLLDVRGAHKGDAMDTNVTRYIQNPDVNLREEDEDGALLFNPDTDRVQLLSSTGFYIWKQCKEERTINEIVNAFKTDYDEVPGDEVITDVEAFLEQLVASGFIGIVEKS